MIFRFSYLLYILTAVILIESSVFAQSVSPTLSSQTNSPQLNSAQVNSAQINSIQANVAKPITALPPVDFSSSIFSMFKALAICIAVLLAVVWVLKKVKSPIVTGQGRSLRIIERLPVSAKSSILLVEVNKKKVLIGVGSDPVNLISDFVDSESLEDIPTQSKGSQNE